MLTLSSVCSWNSGVANAEVTVQPGSMFTWDGIDGPLEESGVVPDNLSTEQGATAFAIDTGHNPPHTIPGLNNGEYGNSNSWIGVATAEIDVDGDGEGDVETTFAGIDFAGTDLHSVTSFAFGRSNLGNEFADRTQGTYYVQTTVTPDPDIDTPNADWSTVGSVEISSNSFPDTYRHLYTLDSAVPATGLRVVTPGPGTCIDEIEIYGSVGFSTEPFEITDVRFDPDTREVSLTFNSQVGQSYALEASSDLKDWRELDDGIEAEGTSTTVTDDSTVPGTPTRHFRIRNLD